MSTNFLTLLSKANSRLFDDQFIWAIQSGSISNLPLFIGREQNANVYDYYNAADQASHRLLQEIRNLRVTKVVRVDDLISASGDDLLLLSATLGLNLNESYLYDSLKQRALNWAANPDGGTEGAIKRALFFFIGSGAFSDGYDPNTGDKILIQTTTDFAGSGVAEWSDSGAPLSVEAEWGSNTIGDYVWSDAGQFGIEDFIITIKFINSGASTDVTTQQFWELDVNRVVLQRVIDNIKPAGYINTLIVTSGTAD